LISGQVRFLRQFARHQFQVIKDTLLGLSLHRVVLGIRVKFFRQMLLKVATGD
jgi:hypothetical protein